MCNLKVHKAVGPLHEPFFRIQIEMYIKWKPCGTG